MEKKYSLSLTYRELCVLVLWCFFIFQLHAEVIQPAILNSTAIKLEEIDFFLAQQNDSWECYVKNEYIYLFSKNSAARAE